MSTLFYTLIMFLYSNFPVKNNRIEYVNHTVKTSIKTHFSSKPVNQKVSESLNKGISSLIRKEINVRNYGATGNGVTDDYPSIVNAINSGYNSIYLPKGIYKITQEINLPSRIRFYGDGKETVLKFSRPDNAQSGYIIKGVDIENTVIENLKIDCSLTSTGIAAIRFEGASNLIINNIWLDQPYNGGINFGGSQFFGGNKVSENCIAKNCKVTNVQYYNHSTGYACFIASGGSKNCTFEDCKVESNICDAYSSDYAFNTKFIRCSFLGSAGAGFTSEGEQPGSTRTVYFYDCIADLNGRSGTGFFISENTNAVINNCTVKNISGKGVVAGVWLQNVNTLVKNCKFFNIHTHNNGYAGGAFFAQQNTVGKPAIILVENCKFYNNTFDISNYNYGARLVTVKFNRCTFSDPVNSYFVSGKFNIEYLNCIFKSKVIHTLQTTSSKAYYNNCKFYNEFLQGLNGIDCIRIYNCSFYNQTHNKTAINIADGSPQNSVKIINSSFYKFDYIVTGIGASDASFKNCKFYKCTHLPKVN